ncbi:hypothetical protein NT6N_19920 [Oceaniferula spumae]|uniref:Alginate export domain-containing protein n=1 Tax=Oceaniferula spumae TaxID=2979115 RepID=A0AAT9FLG7_9BACT
MVKSLLFISLITLPCSAGTPAADIPEPTPPWLSFSLESRLRYEMRNEQGLDNSHALTLRARPGLQIGRDTGFSAFIQSEHTLALIDDYQVGTPQSARFDPYVPGNTVIGDPENNELNQLYLQYHSDSLLLRAGRQRLILDNASMIGNVGWRQNEQTLDAALVSYTSGPLTVQYAYANRVNRIFGNDATGAVQALEGDVHLLNAAWKIGKHSVHGYIYLMDFSEQQFARASNNTYGAFTDLNFDHGSYHLEVAAQNESGQQPDYTALYGHVNFSKKSGDYTFVTGVEYLEQDFVTPLATVHAFNGFADVFINDRLGLTGGPAQWNGLTDVYAGISTQAPYDIKLSATAHAFFDDELDDFYGWEIDAVAVKQIAENTKLIAKFAQFFANDDTAFANDVSQFSLQLDFTY